MDPSKVRVAVASGAVAAAVTATIFVLARDDEKPTPKPESVMLAAPPAAPAPLESPLPSPVATATGDPAVPPPPPAKFRDERPSPGEITDLLVTARRVENTDPKRSRELLFLALVGDPENTEALERLSKKLLTDENPRSANDLIERCLRVEPKHPECTELKAKMPPIDAPSTSAVSQAKACLDQNPNAVDCMYTLADNAFHEGKRDGAALIAIGMHRVAPESATTKYTVGRVRAMYGEYATALKLFASACDLGNKEACLRADLLRGEGW